MKTFISRLAERGPYLIHNQQVYFIESYGSNSNKIYMGGIEFNLSDKVSFSSLERLDRTVNREEIRKLKARFISGTIGKEMGSNNTLKEIENRYKLVRFAIDEVIPLLVDRSSPDEILTLINGEEETEEEKPTNIDLLLDENSSERYVLQKLSNASEKIIEDQIRVGYSSFFKRGHLDLNEALPLISYIVGDFSIFVSKERVYQLTKYNGIDGLGFSLDGQKYSAKFACDLKDLEKSYLNLVEKFNNIEAVKEFEEQFKKTELEKFKLKKGIDFENVNYNEGNAGVTMIDGEMYVFLRVESEFCLKNKVFGNKVKRHKWNGEFEYSLYKPCRVGVRLRIDSKGIISFSENPLVLDEYSHPFLQYKEKPMQGLCMGQEYRISSSLGLTGKVAKLLSDSRRTILHGLERGAMPYHFPGYNVFLDYCYGADDYHGEICKGVCFSDRAITLDEIKEEGLCITNISSGEAKELGVKPILFV